MTSTKLFGRDLKEYEDVDFMELLEKLTPEEIEELSNEIDPDNSLLPPSERCRNQTTKESTGPLNREKLLKFLEEKAKADEDWKEAVPYEGKKTRGKVFVPKKAEPTLSQQELADLGIETEFDDVLNNATEEELVDLAAILECTGILNQLQFHGDHSQRDNSKCTGFDGLARHEKLKLVPDEPPNTTDIEASIKSLEANDPELTVLNLNNIKNISQEQFERMFDALKKNTKLESLLCANTQIHNHHVLPVLEVLRENKTLRILNFESNFLSGDVIVQILQAINFNNTLSELHLANQRQKVLGVQIERKIADLVKENKSLIRLGIDLETLPARIAVRDHLQKTMDDQTRRKRRSASRDPE